MISALGLRAGKDIDRTIPVVTRDLGLQGLVRSTASYDIGLVKNNHRLPSLKTSSLTLPFDHEIGPSLGATFVSCLVTLYQAKGS